MQGKVDKCQHRLDQLKEMLQPVQKPSSKERLCKDAIQEPLFIEHPVTCECVSCLDPALHIIIINHLSSLSNYFASILRPEQSIKALEVAESVCEHSENKMTRTLERVNTILYHSEPKDSSSKTTKKKRGVNSAKGKKQKEDATVANSSISRLMFSQHYATLYSLNAKLLLENGKVEKANVVLSRAMELLRCVEDTIEIIPIPLLPIKASLLYLSGVATLLCNQSSSSENCNWFSANQTKTISSGNTEKVLNSVHNAAVEEVEPEMPRKGSSRRNRTSKKVEDNEKKKPSRAKGKGKTKKVEENLLEDDESDVIAPQKPKGRSKRLETAKVSSSDVENHNQGICGINLQIIKQFFSEGKVNIVNIC